MIGVVLAGGRSTRLGQDKVRLRLPGDGRDMLARTADLLAACTDGVVISCRAPDAGEETLALPGIRSIPDAEPGLGPLGGVGDKLSDSDKAGVKADLDSLRAAIDSTDAENMSDADVDKIKAAKDKLMESAQNLFSKLYEQNGPGANAGTGAGTPDYSDGDVVDGDFTEV